MFGLDTVRDSSGDPAANRLPARRDRRWPQEINRLIKDKGPKGVSSQTQGDTVRVNGKKRDDLQAVIALIKAEDLGIPVQFQNFRD